MIIPTYHDWDRLSYCITSLTKQTYPGDRFEVIIVNNDPEDTPPELSVPENFQILSEAKPGSYAARNTGIRASKGEIMAFTDSDCIPYKDWIQNAVGYLQNGSQRIAGRVELFYHADRLTFAEKLEKAFAFRQQNNAALGGSVTANMVTWRHNFDRVGLFDSTFLSGGDMEWGFRANAAGIGIDFADDAVVRHPARLRVRELLNKQKRVAGGVVRINRPTGLSGTLKWIILGFIPPVHDYKKNIRNRSDLTVEEKVCSLALLWFLKAYSTCQKLILMAGMKKPGRH